MSGCKSPATSSLTTPDICFTDSRSIFGINCLSRRGQVDQNLFNSFSDFRRRSMRGYGPVELIGEPEYFVLCSLHPTTTWNYDRWPVLVRPGRVYQPAHASVPPSYLHYANMRAILYEKDSTNVVRAEGDEKEEASDMDDLSQQAPTPADWDVPMREANLWSFHVLALLWPRSSLFLLFCLSQLLCRRSRAQLWPWATQNLITWVLTGYQRCTTTTARASSKSEDVAKNFFLCRGIWKKPPKEGRLAGGVTHHQMIVAFDVPSSKQKLLVQPHTLFHQRMHPRVHPRVEQQCMSGMWLKSTRSRETDCNYGNRHI